ncbi:MAG: hypothetical protein JWN79_3229 [Gemmatimonadetes bacterium]|jgi:NadR type nicotinamide-nucleotide adenylyltransferase|nr:hypothetical protein [Gemmatimonadota bacterium]
MLRVCVTGPESTGKTTLAEALAARAGTAVSQEASRRYAEGKGSALDASDVAPIARVQVALDDAAVAAARARGATMVVLDTDLWSTVVYARHYYGDVPAEVLQAARARGSQLYLLCDVDVPWIPDGIRDSPDNREAMFAQFRDTLVAEGITPVVVHGSWEERWRIATRAVDALGR